MRVPHAAGAATAGLGLGDGRHAPRPPRPACRPEPGPAHRHSLTGVLPTPPDNRATFPPKMKVTHETDVPGVLVSPTCV